MNKSLVTVIKFEITRQLKKPSFWLSVLLIPAFMGLMFFIGFTQPEHTDVELDDDTAIAITDEAGILPPGNPFDLYQTKEEGIAAVQSGDIDLYYYIPADFVDTKKVEFYQMTEGLHLFDFSSEAIKDILKNFVAAEIPEKELLALTGEYEVETNQLSASGEDANVMGHAIIPGVILVSFFLFLVMSGNRLTMTVVEEKENRISEMILTAVSAKHLIIGKIIAMIVLGLIQILAFIIPVVAIVFAYRDNPTISQILSSIVIDPFTIFTSIILFLFSILFITGILTLIGASTPNAREASNFMAPVIVASVFPLYFMQLFLSGEVNFLVEFITYFPFSAPIALMLRNTFGTLSTPELIIGLVEISLISIFTIYLTARTFQKNAINFEIVLPKFLKKRKR